MPNWPDPTHPELTLEDLTVLHRKILRKLGEVSAQLEEVLAGQEVDLISMPLVGEPDPEWRAIIRLRQYKDHLNGMLKKFPKGTYGICEVSGEPIPKAELSEMPWADVAAAYAEQQIVAKRPDQDT